LPNVHKALSSIPSAAKKRKIKTKTKTSYLGVSHICNPSTQEAEAEVGGLQIQG
jgi:hypothetical protein